MTVRLFVWPDARDRPDSFASASRHSVADFDSVLPIQGHGLATRRTAISDVKVGRHTKRLSRKSRRERTARTHAGWLELEGHVRWPVVEARERQCSEAPPVGPSDDDDLPIALVLIADTFNHRIRRITPDGIITMVAGTGTRGFSGDGGPAVAAEISTPSGLAADAAGNLFIAGGSNYRTRKITPAGVITTVAGTGIAGLSGDGGPAEAAQFNFVWGIAVDAGGNLFVADTGI